MPHWLNLPGRLWQRMATPRGRGYVMMVCSLMLAVVGVGGIVDGLVWSALDVTPETARMGWNEALAKQEAPAIAAQMPKFAITDSEGNVVSGAGKSAELWKFAKAVNGGKHIATWRQESGDCVSMGWANALAYRMAFQIASDQRNEVLKTPFPPYMYGISRVQVGKRQLGRGAGSVGAWAAQGSIGYGVETIEHAGSLGFRYSGRLADQWGWQGPPQACITEARKFRVSQVAQVRSWEDVRDALVHGYPVTVASNVGFNGGHYDKDGKRWLRAGGSWGHQMCFIGIEDRPGRVKGAYCLNSWGEDAHPKPLNDEPPGGFWVEWQTVQRMVQQGDSWAYSDFDGFPASDTTAEWTTFKADVEASPMSVNETEMIALAEQRQPEPAFKEVRQNHAFEIGIGIIVVAAAGLVWSLWLTRDPSKSRRRRARRVGADKW